MKDYSAMSDFDINLLVNRSLGLKHYPNEEKKVIEVFGDIVIFDPCNNPGDAWPIVVASNISLHAPRFKEGWMAEFTGSDEDVNDGFDVDYFESHNENPLRAAMIVFLMKKDAEKGHG